MIGRTIAIVGRPNVGKSALFNRLAGRRMAIVHAAGGVTRDRLSCRAAWKEQPFELIDTGGINPAGRTAAADRIARETRRQVDLALEDAAAVILVTDLQAGILPLDREVARLLHEGGRPVSIAANKADEERMDLRAAEFEELGFPVTPVSALHARGLTELIEPLLETLPPVTDPENEPPLKLAFAGRPNSGKSSLVNRILRSDRVIVSATPGTTRDSIEIPFSTGSGENERRYLLIDTAGLRKTNKVKSAVEHYSVMRAEDSIRQCDIAVLAVDALEGPKRRDKAVAAMILEEKRGCLLVITKWDLAGERTQRAYLRQLKEALPFLDFAPVLFTSAVSGMNIRRLMQAVDHVGRQVDARLGTGMLNRILQEVFARTPPAMIAGKRLKLYYASQTGVRPVRIRLFVNDARRVPRNYPACLEKSLRHAFGLEGAPVVLQFRNRPRRP